MTKEQIAMLNGIKDECMLCIPIHGIYVDGVFLKAYDRGGDVVIYSYDKIVNNGIEVRPVDVSPLKAEIAPEVIKRLREFAREAQKADPKFMESLQKDVRSYNVGSSDYSKHKLQPWDIWKEYHLNPWDADIVKRILRCKQEPDKTAEESRIMDYEKIIHICKERISQLKEGYHF